MSNPLAGTQYRIELEGYVASIASVGASIRSLSHEGRDLVVPYDEDEVRPAYRGALLAPWPNRVTDGRYTFDELPHQLPINEVERGHALHGLTMWDEWQLVKHGETAVTLKHQIAARDGYPFQISLLAVFGLTTDGLACSVTAMNTGPTRAPYGVAPHPYLSTGTGSIDEATLSIPADKVLLTTPDRLIPTDLVEVTEEGGRYDFREPHLLGPTVIDNAFTSLAADASGQTQVSLTDSAGIGARVMWESRVLPWLQVCTGDHADPALNRAGVAVEPMTCPPDAFNTGTSLVIIEPGHAHTASWLIGAIG